jgi:hypothetical protein
MSLNVIGCSDLPHNVDWTKLCKLSVSFGNSWKHSHRIPYKQEVAGSSPALPTKIINKNAPSSEVRLETLLRVGYGFTVLSFSDATQ